MDIKKDNLETGEGRAAAEEVDSSGNVASAVTAANDARETTLNETPPTDIERRLNDQRAAVRAIAGDNPDAQLRAIEALKSTWASNASDPVPTAKAKAKTARRTKCFPSPRGGSVEKRDDAQGKPYWRARVTLCDGTRKYLPPRFSSELLAREYAAEYAAEIEARGVTASMVDGTAQSSGGAETCDAYFKRLTQQRESRGITRTDVARAYWREWIAPHIGHLPVAAVTKDKIEDIRNALDKEVEARIKGGLGVGMSGGTAIHIWALVRTMFKAAFNARDRAFRVRADDPSAGVERPVKTPKRSKTFLYPVELLQLLECEAVPVEWRRAYAVSTYLYLRPEELLALTWRDVDFTAGTVSVNKAMSAITFIVKELPKTDNAVRDVPIDQSLLPLLRAMHATRDGDDAPVVPVLRQLSESWKAKKFRAHLRVAGVTRPRLFMHTPTLIQINFRSCRDTGITWLALKGVPLHSIQRQCGHASIETTNGYVKLPSSYSSGTIGEPFPPIPVGLL